MGVAISMLIYRAYFLCEIISAIRNNMVCISIPIDAVDAVDLIFCLCDDRFRLQRILFQVVFFMMSRANELAFRFHFTAKN